MKNNTKIYVIYVAAVLAVGSVYMYFQHDDKAIKPEKGNVTIITTEKTDPSGKTTSAAKSTTVHTTKYKSRTTTVRTSAETIVTETTADGNEVLWLDINEADAAELMKLPEIGEVLAGEIVSYRNNVGRFRNIEEIMNISGIGQGKFEAVRDYIYVTDPVYDTEEQVTEEEIQPEPEPVQEETEHIPTLEEAAPVDLNTADKETLMLLPYVDEEIAQQIIEFREKVSFRHPYELLLFDGMTQDKVAEIIQYVVPAE